MKQVLAIFRSQRGQTLIEFAFVAPVIIVFLLALVDFGIALDRRVVLEHSVREGGRYASVGGNLFATGTEAGLSDIQEYVAAQAQDIVEPGVVDVCYDDEDGSGTPSTGDNVRVGVTYTHDFVTGFTDVFDTSLASIQMNPDASARLEYDVSWGIPQCT